MALLWNCVQHTSLAVVRHADLCLVTNSLYANKLQLPCRGVGWRVCKAAVDMGDPMTVASTRFDLFLSKS